MVALADGRRAVFLDKDLDSLTPVNLLNALASPNTQAVLTTNDMLIKIRVTTYRSSQQKDSGGGGGGGMSEWYVGAMHVRVIV